MKGVDEIERDRWHAERRDPREFPGAENLAQCYRCGEWAILARVKGAEHIRRVCSKCKPRVSRSRKQARQLHLPGIE